MSDRLNRWVSQWLMAVARKPVAALLILASVTLVAGALATRLGINTDSSQMIAASVPAQDRAERLKAAFPGLRETVVVVARARRPEDADAALAQMAEHLALQPEAIERFFAPSLDPLLQGHGLLLQPLEQVERDLATLSRAAGVLGRLADQPDLAGLLAALSQATRLAAQAEGIDPSLLGHLLDQVRLRIEAAQAGEVLALSWQQLLEPAPPSLTTRVLLVEPRPDYSRLSPVKPALDALHNARERVTAPGVEIGITGAPALRAEELRSVTRGMELSLILSLGMVTFLLLWAFRRWVTALVTVLALILSLIVTAGLAKLTVGEFNLVSIAFAVLMIGLGLDFSIHLALAVGEARRQGRSPTGALALAGARIGRALVLGAVTTAVAFASFSPTDFVGMAQLGIIGALGVLVACAVSLTLLPAVISLAPRRLIPPVPHRRGLQVPARAADGLALALVLAALPALWLLPQVRFDADPMALRDPLSPSVVAYGWLSDSAGGAADRQSLLVVGEAEAKALAARLETLPQVGNVVGLHRFVPADQDAKLMLLDVAWPSLSLALEGTGAAAITLPEALATARDALSTPPPQIAAQAQALAATLATLDPADTATVSRAQTALFQHYPAFQERLGLLQQAGAFSVADLPPALVERYRRLAPQTDSPLFRLEVSPADGVSSRAMIEALRAEAPQALSGGADQILAAGDTVGWAMIQASLTAGLLVAGLLLVLLRSALLTLLVLAPLTLAGLLTCAATVLLGQPFNFANVIVLPLLIGLGVDSGLHLVLRDREAQGESVFATTTPRAITFSALTTIAAFGSLALSDHRGTASMGLLLAVALGISLLCMLVVLPALLKRLRGGP